MTNNTESTLDLRLKQENDTKYEHIRTADGTSGIEPVYSYLVRCREQHQPYGPQSTDPDTLPRRESWRTRQRKVESMLRVKQRLNQRRARLVEAQSESQVQDKQSKTKKMVRRARKHERLVTRDEDILEQLQRDVEDSKNTMLNAYHMNPKERQGRRAIIQEHIDYMRELTTSIHSIRHSHENEEVRRNQIRWTMRLAKKHLRMIMLYVPAEMPALFGLAGEFEHAKDQLERTMAACFVVSPLDGIFYREFPEFEGVTSGSPDKVEETGGAEGDDWVIVEDS